MERIQYKERMIIDDTRSPSSMQNNFGSIDCLSPNCIFRIPDYIRKGSEDAYRPIVISIGPVYYKDTKLEAMQEVKWIYLNWFVDHPMNAYRNNWVFYNNFVRERETKIGLCYEKNILKNSGINSDDFINMILMDSAFIIYFFLVRVSPFFKKPVIQNQLSRLLECAWRDLYLLENQIPFFIVNDLFLTSFGFLFPNYSFTNIACPTMLGTYFFHSVNFKNNLTFASESVDPTNVEHLLHLYWMCCLHNLNLRNPNRQDMSTHDHDHDALEISYLTLKDLQASGVKIIASESLPLPDIEYKNGVLKIPTIKIDETIEPLLKNLLYFEQCYSFGNTYIADYVSFLDHLINTGEDVQILVDNKILIRNGLGSVEAVANFINNLTKDLLIVETKYYYKDICKELNAYASRPWNKWKAILRRQYFNHPWAAISVFAAIILFLLTTLQTIAGFKN
ncbi:unnamed protein product [Amaranthus hypochondriacus]